METLIIILIVVMIAQTCIFIYANFIDISHRRESAASAETLKDAQHAFITEKDVLLNACKIKDEVLAKWAARAAVLDSELEEARKVIGLLKNRTAFIEGLEDSFNQQAEHEWKKEALKAEIGEWTQRRCFVEGMKAAAEWICRAVGVKVELWIDGRFDDEQGAA